MDFHLCIRMLDTHATAQSFVDSVLIVMRQTITAERGRLFAFYVRHRNMAVHSPNLRNANITYAFLTIDDRVLIGVLIDMTGGERHLRAIR